MIGVLLATHGKFAEGIQSSIEMIMGDQEQFDVIGLFPESDLENFKDEIYKKITELDSGDGVLVFADLFGASPANFAISNVPVLISEGRKIRIITGLNLGMLLEALGTRTFECNLDAFYQNCIFAGKDGIRELIDDMSATLDDDDD